MLYDIWPLQLKQIRPTIYVGRIEDERLLQEAEFYLAIKWPIAEPKLIESVLRQLKISSSDVIDIVASRSLPGIMFSHIDPLHEFPNRYRPHFYYFRIDKSGSPAYWEGIKGSKSIGIYVPESIPLVKLELYSGKILKPAIFDNWYEAIEFFLNSFVGRGFWWSCVNESDERLFPWNDVIHQGKTIIKINVVRNSSKGDEFSIAMKMLPLLGEAQRIPMLAEFINRNVFYQDFYIMLDWEKEHLRFLLDAPQIEPNSDLLNIQIPPIMLETLKTCSYPDKWKSNTM